MSAPAVRPWKSGDLKTVAALCRKTFNSPPWNEEWTEESARAHIGGLEANPAFRGFVAEIDGQTAGALLCHLSVWYRGKETHIDEFFIVPEMQGRGAGKLLLEKAAASLKEEGVFNFTLLTTKRSAAEAFYLHLGFQLKDSLGFYWKDID